MTATDRPRLLYLHNSPNPNPVNRLDGHFVEAGFAVDLYRACEGEFPERLDGYAGAFLSGSPHGAYEDLPWIQREHTLIEELARREVPTLGVCFGSQILASALCGRDQVFRRPFCEVGYKWLDVHRPAATRDPLTRDLGDRVLMFVWHNDEVRAQHPGMTILASSDLCPNHVWRFGDLPIWGIQGHPEVLRARAREFFEPNRARLERDGADVDRLIAEADDALEAKTMLRNFIQLSLGRSGVSGHR